MSNSDQLNIDTNVTAEDMAEAIFGDGIEITSASFFGAGSASGIFSNGDNAADNATPSDTGVILSTGKAQDYWNDGNDANIRANTSTNHGLSGDSDLNDIAGATTYDAAGLEVTFVPTGSEITMQVVFSSEEYLEYVGSGFNDAVGIFVNGVKAELTVGDGDITINNINDESNQNLFLNNPANSDPFETEMDELTVTMTLKAPVIDGENTLKIVIADGGDGVYDSNLLIAGDSIQSVLVAEDDDVYITGTQPESFDVLANDYSADSLPLKITEINGQPVKPGDSVLLSTGETVTLNDDGTLTFTGDGDFGENVLSYLVEDDEGNTDVGFINLTTAACFTAGTRIVTVKGEIRIEDLKIGDQVITRDNGFQSIEWIGRTETVARGKDAPVVFEADAIGNHGRIEVSPNHRVLMCSPKAQLLFGEREVLVKAKDLINDKTVWSKADGSKVTYLHILFRNHEIVIGNGLPSESYHPGDCSIDAFDEETRAEILRLMPELAQEGKDAYGPAARVSLKRHEANVLLQQM